MVDEGGVVRERYVEANFHERLDPEVALDWVRKLKPILIAVPTVCGSSTSPPRTNGAAPAAWKPSIRGRSAPAGAPLELQDSTAPTPAAA